MKRFLTVTGVILIASSLFVGWYRDHCYAFASPLHSSTSGTVYNHPCKTERSDVFLQKISEAKQYASRKGLDTSRCFLIDLGLPSYQNRFFVVDLAGDSIVRQGLVTHGNCNRYWLEGRKYGNTVGCGCSSLGKYKVGYSYYGTFGLAFKLYGLESTNSKAFERYVVLHSHECVPESEAEWEICQSNGCPTVAPGLLNYLEPIIKKARKPLLLWIYDDD